MDVQPELNGRSQLRRTVTGVPRWPATSALLIIGGIYLLVSGQHVPGPPGLILALIVALLVLLSIARATGRKLMTHWLALGTISGVTVAVVISAAFLVLNLAQPDRIDPRILLRDAALIWLANVLAFAVWYWEIDGGGPAQRRQHGHTSDDFLFPQMTSDSAAAAWSPTFIDYLFLAFNTSTAFSPTDTMVLSHRAKLLMMLQSIISLVVIAVLAARAINTL